MKKRFMAAVVAVSLVLLIGVFWAGYSVGTHNALQRAGDTFGSNGTLPRVYPISPVEVWPTPPPENGEGVIAIDIDAEGRVTYIYASDESSAGE